MHKARFRALEGCCVSFESTSIIQDGDEGVIGRNGKEKLSLTRVIDCPFRQINDFLVN